MLKMLLSRVPLARIAVSSKIRAAAAGSNSRGPAEMRSDDGCRPSRVARSTQQQGLGLGLGLGLGRGGGHGER